MALNKLVGGDCGGNNTLVQLSSIVSRDAALNQMSQADRFVQEFAAQNMQHPQTFNMNNLLHSVNQIDAKPNNQVSLPGQVPQWKIGPSTSRIPYQTMMRPQFQNYGNTYNTFAPQPEIQIEYINESELMDTTNKGKYESAEDQETYDNLMSFMKKVIRGDEAGEGQQRKLSREEQLNEMAEKYKDEWSKLSDVDIDYWPSQSGSQVREYEFTEGNVMLENKNALEIGKEKLKMGDIPGAVLCFEAAVKQQPTSAEAWTFLGQTQAENEQDPQAIAALRKAIELEPFELAPYMTLAAAYANENMPNLAFLTIYDWLKANPMYTNIVQKDFDPTKLENSELETHLKGILFKAAQLNAEQLDPEVQNAFGVLFNVTQEYDKAVDCFNAALGVKSDDSRLWNRLGATLANSSRSEEAVEAYHRALELEPGFIRARYNVGITCMNLGAHRQAAEHFIVALNQQAKAKSLFPESSSSDTSSSTIWSTLRMVSAFLGEYEATKYVDERNLEALNRHFEVQ